jgi:hypothetical protein
MNDLRSTHALSTLPQSAGSRDAFWLVQAFERQSTRLIDRFAHQSDDSVAAADLFDSRRTR